MRNFLILILSITALIMITNNNAGANVLNKLRKGFYFEKYKTVEEAKAALLELHPIGSDVDALIKTLERVGAKEDTPKDKKENGGWDYVDVNGEKKKLMLGNFLSFYYEHGGIPGSLFPRGWTVFIEYKENKILDIYTNYYQGE